MNGHVELKYIWGLIEYIEPLISNKRFEETIIRFFTKPITEYRVRAYFGKTLMLIKDLFEYDIEIDDFEGYQED